MGTAAAVVGGSVVGGLLSSRSQRKAADKQAQGIKDAQGISAAAAAQARSDALRLFDPAFSDISTSLNQARGDLLSGRTSAQDLLNQSFSRAANTLQTSGQQSINALLGRPGNPSERASSLRSTPRGLRSRDVLPRFQDSTPGRPTKGDDGVLIENRLSQQTQAIPSRSGEIEAQNARALATDGGLRGSSRVQSDPFGLVNSPGSTLEQEQTPNIYGEMQPLEGEFIPAEMATTDFNLQAPAGEYGLAGAESALRQGLSGQAGALTEGAYGAIDAANQGFDEAGNALSSSIQGGLNLVGQGVDQGRSDISSGLSSGLRNLYGGAQTARGDISNQLGAGLADLYGGAQTARGDISGQLEQGLGALRSGVETGRGDISSSRDAAIGYLDPYSSTGQQALQKEAALSGALGAEAQAAAFDAYQNSPGQQFLRDRQEQSLLRNAAATTGVASGNVLTALQEQAAGIASQNYQQDLENLRSLSGRGQQAATTQGGYQTQAGRDLSNLAFQGGAAELGARQTAGGQLADIASRTGQAALGARQVAGGQLGDIASRTGQAALGAQQLSSGQLADLAYGGSQFGAGLLERGGSSLADLAANRGLYEGGIRSGLGRDLAGAYGSTAANVAGLRQNTGQLIAQQLGLTGQQVANLESQLGTSLANIDLNTAANLANFSAQQGQATSGLRTGLAALLANLATGAGSQQANLATQLGGAQAAGVTNPAGNILSQLTGLYASNPDVFKFGNTPPNNPTPYYGTVT